ncbi:MAG: hypothetical protein JXM73_17595, partial [Anaerolineae bacterium]|nr:hypothetical protein [Anaerolineae bacterium]
MIEQYDDSLQAEAARLRQTLASLDAMVAMGLPVAQAQAQARERLADLEARLPAGPGGVLVEGDVTGDLVTGSKVTTFDQRRQTVGRQVNLVG